MSNRKAKQAEFPQEILVQSAFDSGEHTEGYDVDWWRAREQEQECAMPGIRTGVYKLVEVVKIDKTETFKRTKVK